MAGTQVIRWKQGFLDRLSERWNFKIMRILGLVQQPCQDNNALIWVFASFAALPEAIVSLSTHDCTDYAWDKGKQLYGPQGQRGGRRHGRKGTPEISKDGTAPQQGPTASGMGWFAFNMGNFIQALGAKLLIIDTGLDFAINWQSFALQWNGCQPEPAVQGIGAPVQNVYGDEGVSYHLSCVSLSNNNIGMLFGIGGWATTVPVGSIRATGYVTTIPWLNFPYLALAQQSMIIQRSFGPALVQEQSSGNAPLTDSVGTKQTASTNVHTIAPAMTLGWMQTTEDEFDQDQGGTGTDNGFMTVAAETQASIFGAENPDPCANFPITGTSPRK